MLIKLRLAGTKNYGAILRHLILDATPAYIFHQPGQLQIGGAGCLAICEYG